MSNQPNRLSDDLIARALRMRSADPDPGLLGEILRAVEATPQPRPWLRLGPPLLSRRAVLIVAVALLLATAGALAIGARLLLPEPPPVVPERPLVQEGMVDVQYAAWNSLLRFFPEGDAMCASISVDGPCFRWEQHYGVVRGPAAFVDGTASLTADLCSGSSGSSCEDYGQVVGTTTFLEIRAEGASLRVVGCDSGFPCIEPQDNSLTRVGLGLRSPPAGETDEPRRYGWPAFDNVITFSLPPGWGANGPTLGPWEDGRVGFHFTHMCRVGPRPPGASTVPSSCVGETYTPRGPDEVPAVVAGYEGWYRELPQTASGARVEEWILDFDGWWTVIQLRTGPTADPARIDQAMELLESIRAAPRDWESRFATWGLP
jgi:hypothetical protein